MVQQVYSLFDRKVKEFGNLVLGPNDASILRSVKDGIVGSGSMVEKHPDDFDLFWVGEFNSELGVIDVETPRLVENVAVILNGGASAA